jgi:FkbM family methyltransferase
VNTEQKKVLRQNMIIYQEYSDMVDGKNVGRFKNTIEETMLIHYWQDRKIPSNLSTLLLVNNNHYIIDNYHYTEGIQFLTYPPDKCIISNVISRNQVWEPHMHRVFEKYINKESIVLEGGCHVGTHTLRLGLLGKQVLSFEPMNTSNTILRSNLKINKIPNVTVYNEGLSNKSDIAYFQWIGYNNPGGSGLTNNPMVKPNYEKNIKTSNYPVNLITIDSLHLDKLDFIKLDVEGYETNVIEGGLDTIKRCKPIITMEIWENFNGKYSLQHAKNTFKVLLDNGYTIHHIQGPDFLFLPSSIPTNDMLIKNVNYSAKTRMGNNIYSNLSYVNTLHKLVFSFTPRAGCSSVVKSYLDSLGLLQDAELYHPFIQAYRTDIMDPNIQYIPINQIKENGYTFIKFIMNPYIRAVSIFRIQTSHNLSFRQYLKDLINNNVNYFNNNDKFHYHQQYINDEEKYITEYIKIDNNETYTYCYRGLNYTIDTNKYHSPHYTRCKNRCNNTFCGDIPKNTVNNNLPSTYKYFYDDEIKSMVELYYRDDIEKYNYEFII